MGIVTKIKEEMSEESLFKVVQILIGTFAVELLLAALLFLVGSGITWHFFFVSFAITVIIVSVINKQRVSEIEIVLALAIIVFFTWLSGEVFDGSWDGNAYHKLAIGLLKNHWNPIHSLPDLALTEGAGVVSFGQTIWVEAYCKVTWIFGASLYAVTGNIETGKSYTLIAMTCAFFLVFYYMRKKGHNALRAVLMACIAAFNPISMMQMTSFYIDGFLHTMLIILVVSLLMLEDKETFNVKTSVCMIAMSMIVCGNIKFTGLLYGGLFCIAYYVYDCVRLIRNDEKWKNKVFKETFLYACLVFVTVVWAGSSAYMTNLIRHGSLTYPLTGEGKVDIMTGNSPFTEENHFKNLFLSLFSRVDNFTVASGGAPELKIPFTFNKDEVSMMVLTDPRISGFGVMFGGLLLVAIIGLIACFVLGDNKKLKIMAGLNLGVCGALMFGIKESWWARYSPYIYFIVLAAVYMTFCSKRKNIMIFAALYCAILMFNNCLPMIYFKQGFDDAKAIEEVFVDLKDAGMIEICNSNFEGVYYNFKDYGVRYRVNNDLINEQGLNTTNYEGTVWRPYQNQ